MSKEEKKVKIIKAKFSVPYRAGMENDPGFKEKYTDEQKTYAGEKVFALFEVSKPLNRKDFVETDDQLMEKGMLVIGQNTIRPAAIEAKEKQYGIQKTGVVSTELKKGDKATLAEMVSMAKAANLTADFVVERFLAGGGSAKNADEVKAFVKSLF